MVNCSTPNHRPQFIAARDSRNRRIPGLYVRNSRYYAQLWSDAGDGKKTARRFALKDGDNEPVRTLQAAREALEIKRNDRRERRLKLNLRIADCDHAVDVTRIERFREGTYDLGVLRRFHARSIPRLGLGLCEPGS